MANLLTKFATWIYNVGAMADRDGQQITVPWSTNARVTATDSALQVPAVYACARLIAGIVSSLPLMVYKDLGNGQRKVDRGHRLWMVLHYQPNEVMTASEFWQAMILQLMLRGNAYAQIFRDTNGDLISLWPLASDQMSVFMMDGKLVYKYKKDNKEYYLGRENVLHIKDIGTGVVGFSKLEFMSASVAEAIDTQRFAMANAQAFGKPSGVLTVDHVLKPEQREMIRRSVGNFSDGGASKMMVLEADMKFQSVSLSPEASQLLETRKFSTEEICRWFGVPPVMIGASGQTTWGSGIAEIMSGFYKVTLNPLLHSIEQSLRASVLTVEERITHTVEFNFDALLRGDIASRYAAYATAVQNGFKTRNEVRQLENDEPLDGGDMLTAQTNLAPLEMLGKFNESQPQKEISEVKQ